MGPWAAKQSNCLLIQRVGTTVCIGPTQLHPHQSSENSASWKSHWGCALCATVQQYRLRGWKFWRSQVFSHRSPLGRRKPAIALDNSALAFLSCARARVDWVFLATAGVEFLSSTGNSEEWGWNWVQLFLLCFPRPHQAQLPERKGFWEIDNRHGRENQRWLSNLANKCQFPLGGRLESLNGSTQ